MSTKYIFGLLSLLGNKHLGRGAEATSSLFPGPVWAEHIPELKRSHVSTHTWTANLKSVQRKLWAAMSLGSPIPSSQQPLGTSQPIRGVAWLIKLGETSHSLSEAYKPSLWVCIQMSSERQSPSPVLDSEKPPHYSVSLMNSEYSRDSWRRSAPGLDIYSSWRGLRQGKMGKHITTPHVTDAGHTLAPFHGNWLLWGVAALNLRNHLVPV